MRMKEIAGPTLTERSEGATESGYPQYPIGALHTVARDYLFTLIVC
jgi:hypothetical protein